MQRFLTQSDSTILRRLHKINNILTNFIVNVLVGASDIGTCSRGFCGLVNSISPLAAFWAKICAKKRLERKPSNAFGGTWKNCSSFFSQHWNTSWISPVPFVTPMRSWATILVGVSIVWWKLCVAFRIVMAGMSNNEMMAPQEEVNILVVTIFSILDVRSPTNTKILCRF